MRAITSNIIDTLRRSPSRRMKLSLAFVLALGGCGEESTSTSTLDLPDLLFEYTTEHLVIHSDVALCAGDLARWEGFIGFAENYLGTNMPHDVRVYVWSERPFDGEAYCGVEVDGGCFRRSRGVDHVFGVQEVMEHELVHALTRDYAARDSFFIEGLAEAVSRDTLFGRYAPEFPIKGSPHVDYRTAGHYVRWLLERFGVEPVRLYMNSAGTIVDFEQIVGYDVEQLNADFFAEAPEKYPALYRYPVPPVDTNGELWSAEVEFSCERDNVRSSQDGLVAVLELDIPSTGFYAFWSSAGGPIEGWLSSVSSHPVTSFGFAGGFRLPPGVIATALLEAGTYEIQVKAPSGVESAVVMIWASASSVPGFPGVTP